MINLKKDNSGFALLMAIIIVGVVVSIGLTVLDLTIKQLRLSTNSKDSESAFHAANAGIECARYWREFKTVEYEQDPVTAVINTNCFGVDADIPVVGVAVEDFGLAYYYDAEYSWNTSGGLERCSRTQTLVMVSAFDATTTISNVRIDPGFLGYPGTKKECEPGGRCTVISSQGYSRNCTDSITNNTPGTVQREVLLEL